jgi:hypothetical protein
MIEHVIFLLRKVFDMRGEGKPTIGLSNGVHDKAAVL